MKQLLNKMVLLVLLVITNLLFITSIYAQAPQKFNYQGIARDAKGNPLANQQLALKLAILPTSDATAAEYEETQNVTTNEFGLYTLQIGNGTAVTGEMKTVKWETGNKYIKVAIDPKGGTNYVDAGTNQLLSVPYAIYADKAGSANETGASQGGTRTGTVSSNAAHVAGDANYLAKFTGLNTIGKSAVYDNGASIGIGTASPLARIHVNGTAGTSSEIRLQHSAATGSSRFAFFADNGTSFTTTGDYAVMNKYTAGTTGTLTPGFPIRSLYAFSNSKGGLFFTSAANVGFGQWTASTNTYSTRMFIDSATGNIGLATVTPAAKLDVNSSANSSSSSDGAVNVGTSAGTHITLDNNEIQAKSAINTMSDLYVNDFGGNVHVASYQNHFNTNGNISLSNGLVATDNANSAIGLGTTAPNSLYKTTITPNTKGGLIIEDAVDNTSLYISKSGFNPAITLSKTNTTTSTPTLQITSASPNSYSQETYTSGGGQAIYNSSSNGSLSNLYSYSFRGKGMEVYTDSNNAAFFSSGNSTSSSALGANGVVKAQYTGTGITDAPGLIGENTANSGWGIGVYGKGNYRGLEGYSASGIGTIGTSNNGYGVYGGTNTTGIGVYGYSPYGRGVVGASDSNSAAYFTAGNSVYSPALTNNGVVHGEYTGSYVTDARGVKGKSIPDIAQYYGVGVEGEGGYEGVYGYGHNTSNSTYGVVGNAAGVGTSIGVFGSAFGTGTNWAGYMSGNHFISGTKNSAFLQSNGKAVLVNCVETPGIWFEDMGSAEITNGIATVDFPEDLRAGVIIDATHKMIVNVTPTGDMGNYWVEKLNDKFILHAPNAANGTTFDWRMSAKRRGYEDYRLEYAGAAVANDKFIKDPYLNKPNRNFDIAADNAAYLEEQRIHADIINHKTNENDNAARELVEKNRAMRAEMKARDDARKQINSSPVKHLSPAERNALDQSNTKSQEKAKQTPKEVSPNHVK